MSSQVFIPIVKGCIHLLYGDLFVSIVVPELLLPFEFMMTLYIFLYQVFDNVSIMDVLCDQCYDSESLPVVKVSH